jgi:RHS repeat-associated protein
MLTGSTGSVSGTSTYDAYGNKLGSTGSASTPLGYDGQYTSSDTGLIYMRARTYDPATAQFLSGDPLDAITGERYSYVGDDPPNATDPTGLGLFEEVAEGIAGWGDTLTFGATKWAREELGDENVNTCSSAYQTGGYAGLGTAALIPGDEEGAALGVGEDAAEAAEDEAVNPLADTTYSQKVSDQIDQGDYHGFPSSVDGFANQSHVTTELGDDGAPYTHVRIPGGYGSSEGVFNYIFGEDGVVTHRLLEAICDSRAALARCGDSGRCHRGAAAGCRYRGLRGVCRP